MDVNDDKYRMVTSLTEEEKDALQTLAWRRGRSMAGYLRYLLIETIAIVRSD
jgi:hypothetical protein